MSVFLPLVAVHLAWTAAAAVVITRRTRNPASAGVWLLLVALLPAVGSLLYVLAGWHAGPHAAESVPPPAASAAPSGASSETGVRPRTAPDAAAPERTRSAPVGRLRRLIVRNCGTDVRLHNRVELLHNGNNAFSSLIASLQRASRSIHMEYYIFRDDRIGRTIAEILMRKARAGVEVRVIYDAFGSRGLSRKALDRLRRAGVEVRPYAPIRFPWFTPRADRRNHRKIVVTDGKTAFLGGINIAKYYLDGNCMGRWRDEHLRIEGDAVADLQRLFIADWERSGGRIADPSGLFAPHRIAGRLPIQIAWSEEGPARHTLAEAFAAAIVRAKHTVRLSSPYFMPPPVVLDAIRIAAHSGVRVAVMIPACSDSPLTDLVSESYVDDLLDAGVELYRYDNGFLHAKVLVADDDTASVGTANMDYRSLQDNLEVTAFLYGRAVVRELAATFDRDLGRCVRIGRTDWRNRPLWRRTLGDLLRLAAPLM